MQTPIIYNLFPRLAGPMPRWLEHARRAAEMGFNWIYVNPVQLPGLSGSLYAVKDYYRINPDFLPPGVDGNGLAVLERTLREIRDLGLRPAMDLVINHTANESSLAREHPDWYVRDALGNIVHPGAVDPANPQNVTVWGDLAEINNENSPQREALWQYWADLVRHSLRWGFQGFRCDAAYKVPADLWRFLVSAAKQQDPEATFFAETLGSTFEQTFALKDAGLDFFFNSSKWWNFDQPWALEQHEQFGRFVPSVSFPETHDTERLAQESGGSEAVQRQRYAFAALFSAGVMMPIGYEYGFRKRLHVVQTRPADWERPAFDLESFIARVNGLKSRRALLHGEGIVQACTPLHEDVLVLERRSSQAPGQVGWIVVNKRDGESRSVALEGLLGSNLQRKMVRLCRDDAPVNGEPVPSTLSLAPAEVVLVIDAGKSGAA